MSGSTRGDGSFAPATAIHSATTPFEVFGLLLDTPRHCSVLSWQHVTMQLHHSPPPALVKSGNSDGTFVCRDSQAFPGFCRAVTQCTFTDAQSGHCSISGHQPLQRSSGVPRPTSPKALPQTASSTHPPAGPPCRPIVTPCSQCWSPHWHCQLPPHFHRMLWFIRGKS